jgi:hypothetical protein
VTATDDRPARRGGVDAFGVLGLPYSPDLTDAEVHAAYLLRLRATHPDHGGDTGAASAVTAAYDALRSGVRRGDLLSAVTAEGPAAQGMLPVITDDATLDRIVGLLAVQGGGSGGTPYPGLAGVDVSRARVGGPPVAERPVAERERAGAGPVLVAGSWLVRGWLRIRYGRPAWLAGRILLAALVVIIAQVAAPGDPAVWALGVGAVTWLVRTGRWDLAPKARR